MPKRSEAPPAYVTPEERARWYAAKRHYGDYDSKMICMLIEALDAADARIADAEESSRTWQIGWEAQRARIAELEAALRQEREDHQSTLKEFGRA